MTTRGFVLRISAQANRHTKEQAAYYRSESGEPLASRWRLAVGTTIRSLRTLPERGPIWRCDARFQHGLRWIPVEGFPKHLVFYRIDDAAHAVSIIDVLHGARDLELELFRELRTNPPSMPEP